MGTSSVHSWLLSRSWLSSVLAMIVTLDSHPKQVLAEASQPKCRPCPAAVVFVKL